MTVTLSPSAPRYAVSDADDPFKKYWWAILMGIVFTALWLLTPMLGEKSVGSTAIDTSKPKVDDNVEQSLVADAGDGINLSMDGTGKKRKEDSLLGSSLYQAPPEETAAAAAGGAALGSATGAGSGSTLAGALKKVSESGGWGEKAQKGFNVPKLAGASLSGMGAASGGRSGSAGSGAFGSSNAKIGFAGTKGLSGGGGVEEADNSKGMAALKAASAQALLAASSQSNDDARSGMSKAFDGAKGGSKIGGGGAAMAGNYSALDAAPANLKLNDPKLDEKKIAPPPGADLGAADMSESDIGKQIAMQLAAAAIGAVIGGPVGGIVTQVAMQAIERQAAQEEKVRELEQKKHENDQRRRLGLPAEK